LTHTLTRCSALGAAPALLTSTPHKLNILAELGIDGCVLIQLHASLRAMSRRPSSHASATPRPVCGPCLSARIGGWKRRPRRTWPAVARGKEMGNRRQGGPACALEGARPVSSTAHPARDRAWRPQGGGGHAGTSVQHHRERGSMARASAGNWGFPTANIDPHNEVYPPIGRLRGPRPVGHASFAGRQGAQALARRGAAGESDRPEPIGKEALRRASRPEPTTELSASESARPSTWAKPGGDH